MKGSDAQRKLRAALTLCEGRDEVTGRELIEMLGLADDARSMLSNRSRRRPPLATGPRQATKPVRSEVIARDGLKCGICGTPVAQADIHLDHIVPWSKGGTTDAANLRVTHSRCNILKGAN